jgi:hypothetical protein
VARLKITVSLDIDVADFKEKVQEWSKILFHVDVAAGPMKVADIQFCWECLLTYLAQISHFDNIRRNMDCVAAFKVEWRRCPPTSDCCHRGNKAEMSDLEWMYFLE